MDRRRLSITADLTAFCYSVIPEYKPRKRHFDPVATRSGRQVFSINPLCSRTSLPNTRADQTGGHQRNREIYYLGSKVDGEMTLNHFGVGRDLGYQPLVGCNVGRVGGPAFAFWCSVTRFSVRFKPLSRSFSGPCWTGI